MDIETIVPRRETFPVPMVADIWVSQYHAGAAVPDRASVPEPISPDDILSAIKAAKDPDDLKARMQLLLDKQDPAFADLLAKSTFAANVLGYVEAEIAATGTARKE